MKDVMELEKTLSPKGEKIRLQENSLTKGFDDFLSQYYFRQGKEIEITQAKLATDREKGASTFEGRSAFLNVPSLPVKGFFSIGSDNELRTSMTYTLVSPSTSSTFWKFTNFFPDLPILEDIKAAFSDTHVEQALLDTLLFAEAEVIVSNFAQTHQKYGIELEAGISFIATLRPSGALTAFAELMDQDGELVLHGRINLPPDDTQVYMPKLAADLTKSKIYPWKIAKELPGIHLQASINCNFKVGDARFKDAAIRIYSPFSPEWEIENDLFKPIVGMSGTLEISKGDLEIDFVGTTQPGTDAFYFEADFEGFSIANLAKLAGVTGNNSLDSNFPDDLQKIMKGVSKLELIDLAFGFSLTNTGVTFSSLTFQIGIPEVNWKIWEDHLVVTGLGSRFTLSSPFANPKMDISLWGSSSIEGVPILMQASSGSGWTFMASLESSQTLPLDKLMKSYTPTAAAPAKLTIDNLLLILSPSTGIQFMGSLAQDPGWTVDLGPKNLTISDVNFNLMIGKDKKVTGQFQGSLSLGGFELSIKYAIPGELVFRSEVDEITFEQLAKQFTGTSKWVPSGFNPKVKNGSLLIKSEKTGFVMQVGGTVNGDTFVFEGRKTPQGGKSSWGIAAGMKLVDPKISKLPGLSALKSLEKVVALQDLMVIVATYQSKDFRFPDISAFSNPNLTAQKMPMPAQSGGLQEGLNVFARWKLDTGGKETKLLRKMLGLDPELDVTLQVGKDPAKNSRVFLDYETKVNKNWPLDCQLGFAMNNGTPEFFLAGQLQAKIDKQNIIFDVGMSFVKSGMYMGGTMKGTVKFNDLQLSNLSLMFGMNWGGIPSLGVAGMLTFPNFSGSVAILFDANDPAKSLLAGSVSDLSLLDIAQDFAKVKNIPKEIKKPLEKIGFEGTKPFLLPAKTSQALDDRDLTSVAAAFSTTAKITLSSTEDKTLLVTKKQGQSWHLTDMPNSMMHYQLTKTPKGIKVTLDTQLYIAPQATQIGSLQFNQGFFLNGTLNILGFKWTSTVMVSPQKGVSVDTYTNKALTIYKPQFFKLSDTTGKTGPRLSLSTFNQPKHEVEAFRKPHFYLNGKLFMLGIEMMESYVQISEKGMTFYLEQNRGVIIGNKALSGSIMAGFSLNGTFNAINNFTAGGDITVAIKGKVDVAKLDIFKKKIPGVSLKNMGTISLNLGAKGSAQVGYQKNKAFGKFSGNFEFQKQKFKFSANLNVEDKAFEKVGDIVFDELKDFFKDILKVAEKWLNWAKTGIIDGVKEIEKVGDVLKNVYGKSAKEAAKILKDAGEEFEKVGKALSSAYKSSAKEVAKTLKDIGATADQIGNAVSKTFKKGAKETAQILKDVGHGAEDVANALNKTFKQSAQSTAKILNDIKFGTNDVGKALNKAYKQSAKDVAKTLKGIGKSSKEIAGVMQKTFKQSAAQAAKTLNAIGASVDDIGDALKNVYKQSGEQAAKIFKSLGKDSKQVAKTLKNTFKMSAKSVGNTMKSVYKLGKKDLEKVLKGAGFAAKEVSKFVGSAFKSIKKFFKF